MMNVFLFIYRLKKLYERTKIYGSSSINYNPNFRSKTAIDTHLLTEQISLQKREGQQKVEVKLPFFLFRPENPFIMFMMLTNIMFITYFFTLMPYFIAFSNESPLIKYFEDSSDVFFIIDLLVNFNITYRLKNGDFCCS